MADPAFARWVVAGVARDGGPRGRPDGAGTVRRAGARRSWGAPNALVGPGRRLPLPWPRALGTPPWGARRRAAQAGAAARWGPVPAAAGPLRLGGDAGRVVPAGRGTSCAAGARPCCTSATRWAPRHVTLVLPGDSRRGAGRVRPGDRRRHGPRRGPLRGAPPGPGRLGRAVGAGASRRRPSQPTASRPDGRRACRCDPPGVPVRPAWGGGSRGGAATGAR